MTPYTTPDAQSIIYVPMRILIKCMDDMANIFVIFDDFWGLWSLDMTPYPTPDAL